MAARLRCGTVDGAIPGGKAPTLRQALDVQRRRRADLDVGSRPGGTWPPCTRPSVGGAVALVLASWWRHLGVRVGVVLASRASDTL